MRSLAGGGSGEKGTHYRLQLQLTLPSPEAARAARHRRRSGVLTGNELRPTETARGSIAFI